MDEEQDDVARMAAHVARSHEIIARQHVLIAKLRELDQAALLADAEHLLRVMERHLNIQQDLQQGYSRLKDLRT